jgi:hypothetical protein
MEIIHVVKFNQFNLCGGSIHQYGYGVGVNWRLRLHGYVVVMKYGSRFFRRRYMAQEFINSINS